MYSDQGRPYKGILTHTDKGAEVKVKLPKVKDCQHHQELEKAKKDFS